MGFDIVSVTWFHGFDGLWFPYGAYLSAGKFSSSCFEAFWSRVIFILPKGLRR